MSISFHAQPAHLSTTVMISMSGAILIEQDRRQGKLTRHVSGLEKENTSQR